MKVSVVEQEHFMLRVLNFSTSVDVPHSHLLNVARFLRLNNEEVKHSWMFLNDSFFDRRIITTPPAVAACACIFLGMRSSILLSSKRKQAEKDSPADKWWTRLAVKDDMMFYTAGWISDVSLSRT